MEHGTLVERLMARAQESISHDAVLDEFKRRRPDEQNDFLIVYASYITWLALQYVQEHYGRSEQDAVMRALAEMWSACQWFNIERFLKVLLIVVLSATGAMAWR